MQLPSSMGKWQKSMFVCSVCQEPNIPIALPKSKDVAIEKANMLLMFCAINFNCFRVFD